MAGGDRRDVALDIVKGVAILLVAACHMGTDVGIERAWWRLVFYFHVPVFFIAAGYFFNGDKIVTHEGAVAWLKKRILRLWLPGVFWIAVFCLLHLAAVWLSLCPQGDFDIRRFTADLLRAPLLLSSELVAIPYWFLHALFLGSLLYFCVELVLRCVIRRTLWVQTAIAVAFLCVARSVRDCDWLCIGRTLTCCALFHVGVLVRPVMARMRLKDWQYLLFSIVCVAVLVALLPFEAVDLRLNVYRCAVTMVIGALAGWFMLHSLGALVSQTRVGEGLAYVGRHSMPIFLLHMLVFKGMSFLTGVSLRLCGVDSLSGRSYFLLCCLFVAAGVGLPIVGAHYWGKLVSVWQMRKR